MAVAPADTKMPSRAAATRAIIADNQRREGM
jgi:hypothetical protein